VPWSTLTAGVPPEPSYDELLRGENQPGPHAFLKGLFRELVGMGLRVTELFREEQGGWLEVARGYCGTPAVGYAWTSERDTSDSSIPMSETYVTYGLPDATLLWSVSFRKRGQLGYATWQDLRLSADLGDHAVGVVDRLWAETYGLRPTFVPEPPDAGPGFEDRVRQHLERFRADLLSSAGGESVPR
jgi:hypothetical protein